MPVKVTQDIIDVLVTPLPAKVTQIIIEVLVLADSGPKGNKGKKPPIIKPPRGNSGGQNKNPNWRHRPWIFDE